MERLRPEHGLHDDLIAYRALQLLYDFHALKYPSAHPEFMDISWFGGREVEHIPSPDYEVLDPATQIAQKVATIKGLAQPVLRALTSELGVTKETAYTALAEYCQQQIGSEDEQLLVGSFGEFLPVTDILPPQEVVEAMWRAWHAGNRICPELEDLVRQSLPAA